MPVLQATLAALLLAADPAPVVVDDDPGARQPQVAVDARGRVFVAYGVGREVRCAASLDGGRSFGPPVTVGTLPTLALGMRRGPRVAATDDAVVVTAIGGEQGMGRDGDLLAWRSADAGASWSGPTRVNDVDGSAREGLHAMAAAPDGSFSCAWNDPRDGRMAVYSARSTDGGRTWGPNRLVYRAPEGPICPCCHPSAAVAPDGTLLVMWRNDLGDSRDMYLARSTDSGATFGPAEKLGRKTWVYQKCPMDGGSIAVDPAGRITTTWMRAEQVFTCDPDGPERLLGPGVQPWAAPGPDGPHVVWLLRRPGDLLHLAPGAAVPRRLAASANDPVVASAPSGRPPVVAAWESSAADRPGLTLLVLEPSPD